MEYDNFSIDLCDSWSLMDRSTLSFVMGCCAYRSLNMHWRINGIKQWHDICNWNRWFKQPYEEQMHTNIIINYCPHVQGWTSARGHGHMKMAWVSKSGRPLTRYVVYSYWSNSLSNDGFRSWWNIMYFYFWMKCNVYSCFSNSSIITDLTLDGIYWICQFQ